MHTDVGIAVGRLPNFDHHIRLRGLPCRSAWLSYDIREFLLGSWPGRRHRSHQIYAWTDRRVGLPHSLLSSMDVACSVAHRSLARTRIALVSDLLIQYVQDRNLTTRRWLVRKGRIEDAKKALLRLTSLNRETNFDVDETIAMMVHTTALEEKITTGASYLDCFRGTDRRRTEIVCMVWAIQNMSGNSFSGYSTYFLEAAGLPDSTSYDFALGQYGINMAGVFGAWFLMTLGIGRRSLYLYGLCGLFSMLFILGFLGLVPAAHRPEASLATGCIMLVWAMCYQLTVGTVCYSLVAELSTRRLQIKTVVLGRNCYNIVGVITSVLTPYMLNPGAWNWGNYTGFFWAGICFGCIIYTYFRVPEPRGRTFAELDLLFERGVSARKFASTSVDVFDEMVEGSVINNYRAGSVDVTAEKANIRQSEMTMEEDHFGARKEMQG